MKKLFALGAIGLGLCIALLTVMPEPAMAGDRIYIEETNVFENDDGALAAVAAVGGIDFNESTNSVQVGGGIGWYDDSFGFAGAILFPVGDKTNIRIGIGADEDFDDPVVTASFTTAF